MTLHEKYRPRRLSQLVGNDRAFRALSAVLGRGAGGRAFWIAGPSGSGKTTAARIIARTVASDIAIEEFDCARDLRAADLDRISDTMQLRGLGEPGGRAWIVNEAHGCARPVIERLLGILERIPAHVVFVFTTTRDGQERLFDDQIDAGPLLSRCIPVVLSNQGLAKPFARLAQGIARREHLDGRPLASYVRLVQEQKNNLRAALTRIEAGEMLGM